MNDNVSVTLEEVFRNSGSPLDRKRGGDQADIVQSYLFISQIVRVPDCIQTWDSAILHLVEMCDQWICLCFFLFF